MSDEKLEQKLECVWYEIAHSQRESEFELGLSKEGTLCYENTGCYDCNGNDFSCSKYTGKLVSEKWYNPFLKENRRKEL